ncbi:hypothetical protein GE09DRAFT_639233 [Coniochaeta sp. 2T2.1]|nr:hypothetical protein GE09DRAFT_639233 [Coniochaeta sp. 2T2.1]
MASVRGRAACDGCRSRKQKCDETKPVCSRCRDANKTCVWPKVHKRGPVKGYSELLKQRLEMTENALLQLLDAVDDKTIEAAFRSGGSDTLAEEQATNIQSLALVNMLGSVEVKKAALAAQWDKFPLRTAEEVKRWAKEARSSTAPSVQNSDKAVSLGATGSDSEAHADTSHAHFQHVQPPIDEGVSLVDGPRANIAQEQHGRWPGPDHEIPVSYMEQQLQASSETQDLAMFAQTSSQHQEEDESLHLSEEFKQQYLW